MPAPPIPAALVRAAPLFGREPEALAARLRDGVVDLLDPDFAPTLTQRSLDTRLTAWLYDVRRDRDALRAGLPDFAAESRAVATRLGLDGIEGGVRLLDVACGHGNFSADLARRVGPEGLVVGVDIAASMLARAVRRVAREELDNVVLVRGDALALPFVDAAFDRVNCSGGLHQMPDLGRALAEMARVARPGARFAASGFARGDDTASGWRRFLRRRFALHFVGAEELAGQIERAGFREVHVQMSGAWFAYAEATRSS